MNREETGLRAQLRRNAVALMSLSVALTALFYNTWRNENTEHNRNIRSAEFEILKDLASLQEVVDYAHFRKDRQKGDQTRGLTYVLAIHDLSRLTPAPVASSGDQLLKAWREHGERIEDSLDDVSALSEQILATRTTVIESLRSLH